MSDHTTVSLPATSVHDEPTKGILLVLAAMAVFTAMDATSKLLVVDYHVVQITGVRYFFQTAFLLPLLLQANGGRLLRTTRPGLQLVRAMGMLGSSIFFILALGRLPIAEATAIGFVSPLFTTALSIPLLGESVGIRRWSAVLVGFIGVLVVVRPGTAAFDPAALLPMGSSVCWALALIASRKIRNDDSAMTTLIYSGLVPLAVVSVVAPFFWTWPTVEGWLIMAVMGGCCALAQYLLIVAYAAASASLLAPFAYSQIIWATTAGFVLFGALPDLWTWAGTAIIVASGLYIGHREHRTARG